MRRGVVAGMRDIVTGAVFFILSAGLLFQSAALPAGAALLPRITLAMLMVLAIVLALRGLRTCWEEGARVAPHQTTQSSFIEEPRRLFVGVLAMALYILAIETVGFYPATAVFVPTTAYALGARNRLAIFLAGLAFLLFAYLVFDVLFERVMPAGMLISLAEPAASGVIRA